MSTVSNTFNYLVRVEQLITLPDIYIAVKEAIEDPDSDMQQLVEIIKYDPAISTKLLRAANSPLYGQASSIDTIDRTVTLLGTKTVHDLVLSISISHTFNGIIDTYDVTNFWQNSIMRAAIAKCCAKALNIPEPDRFFTLGLLSDIGHMAMAICEPGLMRQVISQQQKTNYPLYLYERSTFGFDSGELGADILDSWSIPESIVNGIRYQNCPELADDYKQEASIIYCAGRLHLNHQDFPNMLDFEVLKQCNMEYLDFDLIRAETTDHYQEALSLFPVSELKKAG
ncbi:MAG: HDOD domain-containing protein [Pseudomonadota bacterium]